LSQWGESTFNTRTISHMAGLANRHIGFTPKLYSLLHGTGCWNGPLLLWYFLYGTTLRLIDPFQLLAGKDVMIFLTGDGERSQSSFIKSPKDRVVNKDIFTRNLGIKLYCNRTPGWNRGRLYIFLHPIAAFIVDFIH